MVCAVALALLYLGVGVGVSIAWENDNTRAYLTFSAYLLVVLVAPIVLVVVQLRRSNSVARALRHGAYLSLFVQFVLVPVGIAALAM